MFVDMATDSFLFTNPLNSKMHPWIAFGFNLVGFIFITQLASYFFRRKSDPREPILLRPKIPFIGHVLGLQKHGNMYMQKLM
jgi:hypothetical protein